MIQLVLLPVAGFDGISGEVVMQKRKFYIQEKGISRLERLA